VLRHDDIADKREAIAGAHFTQDAHGEISRPGAGEQRTSLITAEGEKVKIAEAGEASKVFGHGEEKPTVHPRVMPMGKVRKVQILTLNKSWQVFALKKPWRQNSATWIEG